MRKVTLYTKNTMCTGIVRGAVCEAIEDKCLSLGSPRILIMKKRGRELLPKRLENEQTMQTFDEFSATLCSKFEKLFVASKTVKSHSTMRGRLLWGAVCVKILVTKTQGFGGIY